MRTDEELTQLIGDWLADEARPLPEHVLESVIVALQTTPRSHGRRFVLRPSPAWQRAFTVVASAAALVVLILVLPQVINRGRGPEPPTSTLPIAASGGPPCPVGLFDAPRTIDTQPSGNGPTAIVAGDFNGDGKADFVVANAGSNELNVGVALGHGDGTFGQPTAFESGWMSSLAAVDSNGDGRLDLVGPAAMLGQLVVLPGDGLGGFRAPRSTELGDDPRGIAVADFNGDGNPDVAVPLGVVKEIAVMLGDGKGGFRPVDRLATDGTASWIAIADYNGDGAADIAVAVAEDHLEVFLGDGRGGFGAVRRVPSMIPYSVSAADVNGDGRVDLIIGAHGEAGVGIHLGDGLGGFGQVDFVKVGGNRGVGPIIVGRFDRDNAVDIAVAADGIQSSVITLKGDGNGHFVVVGDVAVGNGPLGMASADFNGDGRPDLVTSDVNVASVSLLLGACGPQ